MRCLHRAQERTARVSTFEFDVESSAAAHPARMLYALPYGAEQQSSMKSVRASRACCHGGAQNRQGGDATTAPQVQPHMKQRVRALRVSAHVVSYGDTASSWKRFCTTAMK